MIRSFVVVTLLTVFHHAAVAQATNTGVGDMIAAEEAFIKMAKEKNTRDAFLIALHDDAVTVGPYGSVIGKAELKKQKPNASWLSWQVAYSDISSAGDLGYNTGPWQFYAARTDSLPVAWGHFHSIWKKQPDGTWNVMADIGITHDSTKVTEPRNTSSMPLKVPAVRTPALEATLSLMNQEKAFLASFKTSGMDAYAAVASKEIRFARQGELPIITAADKAQFLKRKTLYGNQVLIDGGIAASGDLGYVYGSVDAITFTDDKQEIRRGVYLRVWKKEDGKTWKIVLDVMGYN